MGISVKLQDERCNVIEQILDPQNLLARVLPAVEDPAFPLRQYIDRYGNTIFNRLQLPELVDELDQLILRLAGENEQDLLAQVRELARRGLSEPHLYVKFEGD